MRLYEKTTPTPTPTPTPTHTHTPLKGPYENILATKNV